MTRARALLLGQTRSAPANALVVLLAAVGGMAVSARLDGVGPLARPEFRLLISFPIAVYPVAGLALLAMVLARTHWWVGLAMFFGWLPIEDLVRKFAHNDLRVYFVKDALFFVALVNVAPYIRGNWRRALGTAWLPTVAVFTFAFVMALPAATIDPGLPLVAIHVRFLYAFLVPVGAYVAQDKRRLEHVIFWLAMLAMAVCIVGIIQSILGPTFLNPSNSTLAHLTVSKTIGAAEVHRPSGTFADVSRYASMTIVGVVLALCALELATSYARRRIATIALVVSFSAAVLSGSRTSLFVSIFLVVGSVLFRPRSKRRSRRSTVASASVLVVSAVAVILIAGDSTTRVTEFYALTVDPRSAAFDLVPRLHTYAQAVAYGIRRGGVLGTGTGTEALGAQYLTRGFVGSGTESGWGSVAVEWGFGGLVVWTAWTAIWLRRASQALAWRSATVNRVPASIVLFLFAELTVMFSLGIGFFENYIANVFFWFLSGIAFASIRFGGTSEPVADYAALVAVETTLSE